jgi:hypothetical protein
MPPGGIGGIAGMPVNFMRPANVSAPIYSDRHVDHRPWLKHLWAHQASFVKELDPIAMDAAELAKPCTRHTQYQCIVCDDWPAAFRVWRCHDSRPAFCRMPESPDNALPQGPGPRWSASMELSTLVRILPRRSFMVVRWA